LGPTNIFTNRLWINLSLDTGADLGIQAGYQINDFTSTDLTVMTGEGYNQLLTDNIYKTGLGLSILPAKGFIARFYVDYTEQDEIQNT